MYHLSGRTLLHSWWKFLSGRSRDFKRRLTSFLFRTFTSTRGSIQWDIDSSGCIVAGHINMMSCRYNASSYENDIALVLLKKLPFMEKCFDDNPAVSAVCVPWSTQLFQPNHTCSISGWGRTAGPSSCRHVSFFNWSIDYRQSVLISQAIETNPNIFFIVLNFLWDQHDVMLNHHRW